ncbi:hypothetical protein HAX54_000131, partial [Datura stramonium]|nr:hypothetical protein [Datura stramonium]
AQDLMLPSRVSRSTLVEDLIKLDMWTLNKDLLSSLCPAYVKSLVICFGMTYTSTMKMQDQ